MFIVLYTSSLLMGIIGALAIRACAYRWGFIDVPNRRSSHSQPTPKGGGIGILAAFVIASLLLHIPIVFWLVASLIALMSFYGDRFELSPKARLPIQFIAAFIFVQFSNFGFMPSALMIAFWIFFIVSTANWYNFMDGINGIAAITGVVAFSLLACFGYLSGADKNISALSICIALSCLGFLPFNMPRAKVFMGDVGSILLGFLFAAIAVLLSKSTLDFVCLAAFLFPFYADELITMSIRISKRENLLLAHRKHLYQLLANELGKEHWKVSIGYGILQVIVGFCVLVAKPLGLLPVTIIVFMFFCAFIVFDCVIRKKIDQDLYPVI